MGWDKSVQKLIFESFQSDNLNKFQELLSEYPDNLRTEDGRDMWLHRVTREGLLPFVKLLIEEFGIDPNESSDTGGVSPSVAIEEAAGNGHMEIVKYLLSKGAKINFEYEGDEPEYQGAKTCMALWSAIEGRHLDMVKFLVEEHDADINSIWCGQNAISYAGLWSTPEIVQYIYSKGGRHPNELIKADYPSGHKALCKEMKKGWGKLDDWTLVDEGEGDSPDVIIHHCPPKKKKPMQTYFTIGMSDRNLDTADTGPWGFSTTELMLQLPADWMLDDETLKDPLLNWPILQMRKIAREALTTQRWQSVQSFVLKNGKSPKPFAENTKLCDWLIEFIRNTSVQMPDYRQIGIRRMIPIYQEEAELIKNKGDQEFFKRLKKHKIPMHIDINRKNVAVD